MVVDGLALAASSASAPVCSRAASTLTNFGSSPVPLVGACAATGEPVRSACSSISARSTATSSSLERVEAGTSSMLQRPGKAPVSSSAYATPPLMPARSRRWPARRRGRRSCSRPWSPTPSTTASARWRTARRGRERAALGRPVEQCRRSRLFRVEGRAPGRADSRRRRSLAGVVVRVAPSVSSTPGASHAPKLVPAERAGKRRSRRRVRSRSRVIALEGRPPTVRLTFGAGRLGGRAVGGRGSPAGSAPSRARRAAASRARGFAATGAVLDVGLQQEAGEVDVPRPFRVVDRLVGLEQLGAAVRLFELRMPRRAMICRASFATKKKNSTMCSGVAAKQRRSSGSCTASRSRPGACVEVDTRIVAQSTTTMSGAVEKPSRRRRAEPRSRRRGRVFRRWPSVCTQIHSARSSGAEHAAASRRGRSPRDAGRLDRRQRRCAAPPSAAWVGVRLAFPRRPCRRPSRRRLAACATISGAAHVV